MTFRRRAIGISVLLAALLLSLTGCGATSTATGGADVAVSGTVTVSAASSLKDAFGAMATEFHSLHTDATAVLNFASSSTLAAQILDGAPTDVFASADQSNMQKVIDAGDVDGEATVFATNSLAIIVRKGNPSNITSLADLAKPGIVYVTCAPEVPIGKYAAQVLAKAGVTPTPASLEPDVKGIVAKVVAGEADAGIVYATDVTATKGAATSVSIPDAMNVVATYPIAVLSGASDPTAARAWVDLVLGDDGRRILQSFGFGLP